MLKSTTFLLDASCIGAGAVCGALLRYGAGKLQDKHILAPWAIPVINMCGSFVMGAVSVSSSVSPRAKLMVGTGFCGSLTTFSTFSVDTVQFIQAGKVAHAISYVFINNVGGILAAALAIKLFRGASPPPSSFLPKDPSTATTTAASLLTRTTGGASTHTHTHTHTPGAGGGSRMSLSSFTLPFLPRVGGTGERGPRL